MEFVLLVVLLSLVVWFAFAAGGWCDELIEWNYRRQCPPLPRANNEKDLERWHDAYDAAILEGKDEIEAVRIADEAPLDRAYRHAFMTPNEKRGSLLIENTRYALWYHSLKAQYDRSLPSESGGMGAIEADAEGW